MTGKLADYIDSMIEKGLNKLKSVNLIKIDKEGEIENLPLSKKMAKNFVKLDTVCLIKQINNNSMQNIVEMLSEATEFAKFRLKKEEKKFLRELNKHEGIKQQATEPIDSCSKKIFVLLQANLSNVVPENWDLRRQQIEIVNLCTGILCVMRQIFKERNDAVGYISCVHMTKCLKQKMWLHSTDILRQLPKVGDKLVEVLKAAGLTTFADILNISGHKIDSICHKNHPFGENLKEVAKCLPEVVIKAEQKSTYKNQISVSFDLKIVKKENKADGFNSQSCFYFIVSNNQGELLMKKKIKA